MEERFFALSNEIIDLRITMASHSDRRVALLLDKAEFVFNKAVEAVARAVTSNRNCENDIGFLLTLAEAHVKKCKQVADASPHPYR